MVVVLLVVLMLVALLMVVLLMVVLLMVVFLMVAPCSLVTSPGADLKRCCLAPAVLALVLWLRLCPLLACHEPPGAASKRCCSAPAVLALMIGCNCAPCPLVTLLHGGLN